MLVEAALGWRHYIEEKFLDRYVAGVEPKLLDKLAYSNISHTEVAEIIERATIDDAYSHFGVPPELCGFLAFTAAADRGVHELTEEWLRLANAALKLPATWQFISNFYDLPTLSSDFSKVSISRPRLHRMGTTSYVIRIENSIGECFALKLLKYRFCFNDNILAATSAAVKPPGFRVWKPYSRCILMDFIEGATLAEIMRGQRPWLWRSIEKITLGICSELDSGGRPHGDLNPHNILIQRTGPDGCAVRLIDYGINYLLREGIGGAAETLKATAYLAHEVVEAPAATQAADAYALGVILLEMMSVGLPATTSLETLPPEDDDVSANVIEAPFSKDDFENYMATVQVESPGLAAVIDDLIEPVATYRYSTDLLSSDFYGRLKDRIELEFFLYRQLRDERDLSIVGKVIRSVSGYISGDPSGILQAQLKEVSALRSHLAMQNPSDKHRDLEYLRNWSIVATASHLTVVAAFLFFLQRHWSNGTLAANLPGLVIMLSFSYVAARYYQSIFSDIDLRPIGRGAKAANAWLRFCAFFWPLAIIPTYYFDPTLWQYACFYGTAVIAVNNYFVWRLGMIAMKRMHRRGLIMPANIQSWLESYRAWHEQMALYSIFLLVIGILLQISIIFDIAVYACLIVLINWKLWLYNCTRIAPPIRNCLTRTFQRYARMRSTIKASADVNGSDGKSTTIFLAG